MPLRRVRRKSAGKAAVQRVRPCGQFKATMSRFKHIVLQYPKSFRGIIEAASKSELKKLGIDCSIRKDLLNQANQLYMKYFHAQTEGSKMISDDALNIRGFVSAIVNCMVFNDSNFAQYIENDVINAANIAERSELRSILRTVVSI